MTGTRTRTDTDTGGTAATAGRRALPPVRLRLTALAPIHHGEVSADSGITVSCRKMRTADGALAPVVSGNALRGVMRRLVFRELFGRLSLDRTSFLDARAWDRLYAALANGGHLEASETTVDPAAIRDLRRMLPPLSLFGAALYSWMLPSSVSVGIAWLACRETERLGLAVGSSLEARQRAAVDCLGEVGYARHIDREEQDPKASGVTPMPREMEVVLTGSELVSTAEFLATATELERACLVHGAYLLSAAGLGLGGKVASGHGRIRVQLPDEAGGWGARQEYAAWLDDRAPGPDCPLRGEVIEFAERLLPRKPKPKPKPKQTQRKAAEGADAADGAEADLGR